jgi:moderate conductance mechanosensitive channel
MPDLAKSPYAEILDWIHRTGGPIALIVVVALVAIRASRLFIHGVVKTLLDREASEGTARELSAMEVQKRIDTLDSLGANVLQALIVTIAGIEVLDVVQLNIAPAIAGLGIAGIALGFGAQSLVKDYLNGALIVVENQFSKGDVVRIGGVSGTVEDFSLRRTTLRDLDGVVHTVPNGEIGVASNLTRVWARINLDVQVAHGTDVDRAIDVVDSVGRALAGEADWTKRILEAPRVERVEAIGELGVTLKILGTVRAQDRWAAAGELRRRLLAAFREQGIRLPQPQRVILSAPGGVDGEEGPTGGGPTDIELAEGSE